MRPNALVECPAGLREKNGSWPSPGTWELAARLLAVSRAAHLRAADIEVRLKGLVGRARAAEFLEVQRTGQLRDAGAASADPEGYGYPEEPDFRNGSSKTSATVRSRLATGVADRGCSRSSDESLGVTGLHTTRFS